MTDIPNQGTLFTPPAEPIARALINYELDEAQEQDAASAAAADEFRIRFCGPPGHRVRVVELRGEELSLAAEALSYTLAQLSRGCPYAPEWSDADIVERVGPLLGRLRP